MLLTLPWPPSTNRTWRHAHGKTYLSKQTLAYRRAVASLVLASKANRHIKGHLEVKVVLFPPDRRKRDEDNFAGKALFDAITKSGVWEDDSQIRRKVVEWGEVTKGGKVEVEIKSMEKTV